MGSSGYHSGSLAKALWSSIWPKLIIIGAIVFCLAWVSAIIYVISDMAVVYCFWIAIFFAFVTGIINYIILNRT